MMKFKNLWKKLGSVVLSAAMILGGAALLPQAVKSSIEVSAAGNSFDTPKFIKVNTPYNDRISSYDEEDYYKFTLNNDSKVWLTFSHNFIDDSDYFWMAHIYKDNDSYSEIYSCYFRGNKKTENTANIGLPKGKYYVVITEYYYSDKQYTLTVNAENTDSWEREFNDTFETATRVYPNKVFSGSIMSDYDTDFYKFTLNSDSKVTIKMRHNYIDDSNYYWKTVLYKDDNENTEIRESYWPGNIKDDYSCSIGLPKGTYYIRVDDYYHSGIDYNFTIAATSTDYWEKELNNVFETATPIKTNSEYKGSIMYSSDSDFYKFTINGRKSVKIKFTHNYIDDSDPYWQIKLFIEDNTNSELKSWYIDGKKTITIFDDISLTKGTYYLRVDDYYYNSMDYGITVIEPDNTRLPTSISFNKTSMALGVGETFRLKATISPSNATNKTVNWSSSNTSVLTVDKNGNVKGVRTGTATVTAKTANGKTASCKITVRNAPSSITLTKGILTIGVGESYTVGSGINDGAACATRTYRTSNSSIVRMTQTDWNGVFVGVKPGVAWVTVRTYNGKESTCRVTVKAAPSKVSLNKKTMTMKVGQRGSLSAIIPDGTGCATRTFRSSNNNVVKMTKTNWTGEFYAKGRGIAYVAVRTYNGKEAYCKITVQ